MSTRPVLSITLLVFVAACHQTASQPVPLPNAAAARRDIVVRVQSTGTLEPIDLVAIRSKASGLVQKMPVDIGSDVKAGDLIVQIDPRDVKNEFEETRADDVASVAAMHNADLQKKRADDMLAQKVITPAEHDSVAANFVRAVSVVAEDRANLDLARQKLEDATVRAPVDGTILSKSVSLGQLVTSATGTFGRDTSIVTMANLLRVRMRVNVDEADLANVRPGEPATIRVDAVPSRSFDGVVEKVEPTAVVNQGVTFFPVLVTIDNHERLLMPGMNGEVTIIAARRSGVLAIPVDAVRGSNELVAIARVFQQSADSLRDEISPSLLPSSTSTTGSATRFAVVALPGGVYELRAIQPGASDLEWVEVLGGIREGERVVMLGDASRARPAIPPLLRLAQGVARTTARAATQSGSVR
ncbi:MAG TPA: efflux RND transporter periplasmic adaptor subunit [Gemmatimonadaceae bacterium]|nr:efflux RND transporter periplasmic adaptor subunit [Gemmatimonadaceae bacterium]